MNSLPIFIKTFVTLYIRSCFLLLLRKKKKKKTGLQCTCRYFNFMDKQYFINSNCSVYQVKLYLRLYLQRATISLFDFGLINSFKGNLILEYLIQKILAVGFSHQYRLIVSTSRIYTGTYSNTFCCIRS